MTILRRSPLRTVRFWFLLSLAMGLLWGNAAVRGEGAAAALPLIAPAPSAATNVAATDATTTATQLAAADEPAATGDEFEIRITPGPSKRLRVGDRSYEEAYKSIPYRRTEYLANPGYRHEAAMEILFGQLRPTTNVRTSEPQWVPEPVYSPYRPYLYSQPDLFHLYGQPWRIAPPVW